MTDDRKRDSYRCAECRGQPQRCEPCRAARAEGLRALRAEWRASGKCVQCGRRAARRGGKTFARCPLHLAKNLEARRAIVSRDAENQQ